MKVAIVHYHLLAGGVTRVVQNATAALGETVSFAILCAGLPRHPERYHASLVNEPSLAYDDQEPLSIGPEEMADRLEQEAAKALGGSPDVWHIHNHSLGKNLVLTQAVSVLAERGHHLLLQIHDFAEDGRPGNYKRLLDGMASGDEARLSAQLYPQAEHVHYAALNMRDHDFLVKAGISEDRVHLLPNAVSIGGDDTNSVTILTQEKPLYLYPTRAIRRKNLGEFILWSAAMREDALFGVTLAPENPTALVYYNRWVQVARELDLPVMFELGAATEFITLVQSAHTLVTTSVAEGFGLAFLEPWLQEVPLSGRDLPEITREFKNNGVDLSALYQRLEVPLEWVGEETLRSRIKEGLDYLYEAYGRAPSAELHDRAWQAAVRGDKVDFGRLDEQLQENVIRHVLDSDTARGELPQLEVPEDTSFDPITTFNRDLINEKYGLEVYAHNLSAMYDSVAGSPASSVEGLSGSVLEQFMAPERFLLLRSS